MMKHRYASLREGAELGVDDAEQRCRRKLWKRSIMSILALLALAALVTFLAASPRGDAHPGVGHEDGRLLFVGVLHRHGARTGIHHYTFENFTWPWKLGALTLEGMEMGFNMGKKLRSDYWRHLTSSSSQMHIDATSTNVPRTIDTVHSALLGLFLGDQVKTSSILERDCSCRPDRGGQASSVECIGKCLGLDSVPSELPKVKVLQSSSIEASLLQQPYVCKEYRTWLSDFDTSQQYSAAVDEFSEQIRFLKKVVNGDRLCFDDLTGKTIKNDETCTNITLEAVERVWDSAVCALFEGIDYPSPTNHTGLIDTFQPTVDWLWHHWFTVDQGPNMGGILLNDILERMHAAQVADESLWKTENRKMGKVAGFQGASMVLYSAHDSTVASLLAALGLENWSLPSFVAHITVELWASGTSNETDPRVVLQYYDGRDGHMLDVRGCPDGTCAYSSLVAALSSRRMTMANCTFVAPKEAVNSTAAEKGRR
ncbi:unnamed protein product [Ostreobium quekettii]|uniref:Uncharacterized protein n=1 Tax=Ostreobium quekettii TaxID=121088 RepID=A0A8S1IP51_9CHLO|nr:unnamed protein product [Ostreobium quekettii]|eukprot:evm.model.scf_1583.2 EVM.evm.TU.scf_1583.2   scf_1583:25417-31561(+)